MSAHQQFDVAVIGGSVAGCVAALGYASRGLRVVVLEKSAAIDDYKVLCTHFIQPIALPVLRKFGLDVELEAHGAVRTKAAFWTRAGWIDPSGDYARGPETAHAYNIERRVLDPMLRRRAATTPGVDLRLGRRVVGLRQDRAGVELEVTSPEGNNSSRVTARLAVAADGRQSRIAKMLGTPTRSSENQRAAFFGYFEGLSRPRQARSLFLLGDREMGFIYPLAQGVTLLSVYVPRAEATDWYRDGVTAKRLIDVFDRFPSGVSVREARPASRIYGYDDYPNLERAPVHAGVAFIGDAVLSLDPMSGVGCAFAICTADALVAATGDMLTGGGDVNEGLAAYEAAFKSTFPAHARGIAADSLIAKSPDNVLRTYSRIVASPSLQEEFIALTGRLTTPDRFRSAFIRSLSAAQASAVM